MVYREKLCPAGVPPVTSGEASASFPLIMSRFQLTSRSEASTFKTIGDGYGIFPAILILSSATDKEETMNFWTKVKGDLQKGVDEGIAFVKEGAAVVLKKAEELTEEGKKRYEAYELKAKVQKEIAELGGQVYDLSSKMRNPMLDDRVKDVMGRIKQLEARILKIEGKQAPVKKAPARKTAAKKTTAKKTTPKKAGTARKGDAAKKAAGS
jgi:hypothetical protein